MLRRGQVLFTYLHLAADTEQAAGAREVGRHRHRLRDRHRAGRLAAAAGADERGRRPHVDPGRRDCLQKANGGFGVLLGGVPGVAPAQRRDPGRRRRRHQRGADGRRARRAGHGRRPLARRGCASSTRSSAATLDDRLFDDRGHRAARDRGRPRDRRGAGAGRRGAEARHARDGRAAWRRARCSSTSRSTRAAASRPASRRRMPIRPTWSTASCTTASPTCRAPCRAPRPLR